VAEFRLRVGEADVLADIDDPKRGDWKATVNGAPALEAGPTAITILDSAGNPELYPEADVIPAGPDGPTRLEGKRPFYK
jgi:hypothetical protein